MQNKTKMSKSPITKEARRVKERLILELGAPLLAKALSALMAEASKYPNRNYADICAKMRAKLREEKLKNEKAIQENRPKKVVKKAKPAEKAGAFTSFKKKLFGNANK